MSNLYLENLKNNRNEILKAEIASMIALWDKINPENINKASLSIEYNELGNWQSDLARAKIQLKKDNGEIFKEFKIWNNFLQEWRDWRYNNSDDYLLQILYGISESLNSGIDKGSPKQNIKVEPENTRWLANAFGSYKEHIIFLNKTEINIQILLNKIRNNIISSLDCSNITFEDLDEIRNSLEELLSGLLSDDRFPINDVSLWEQTYMATSMFKALLSDYILTNLECHETPDRQKVKWSILGIQYDKLGLAEKGLKASSIKWYRETSDKVDNEIKTLLEIEYPIGNEVYRDETGIYFVVGEDLIGDKDGDFYKLHSDLIEIKEKIQEIFTNQFEGEIYPAIFLTEPSRGIMNLGHLVEKAKENFLKAEIPSNFKGKLESKYDSDPQGTCQICKLRLANKQSKDDLICDVCKRRMEGRIDEWLQNLDDETIWTDELQDKNGRIALVTLKFELDRWINGDLVNSLVVQNFDLNSKKYNDYLNSIIDGIKNNKRLNNTLIKDYHTNIPNLSLKQLAEKWFLERSIGSNWEKFIKDKLEDKIDFEMRNINWNKLGDSDIEFLSQLILQFLLRKNPSPARLKRVWDTTREFFEELKHNIVNLAGIKENRQKRPIWNGIEIENGEYCDGDILFWAKNKTVYLISSIEKIDDKNKFHLRKYKSDDNSVVVVATLNIEDKTEQPYKPSFSIMDPTPISWQFIIPAENIPILINNVQEEYFKHFKYVYGKLPLHIGVIIQDYKKPLYIGIKAIRKIRRDKQKWSNLRIELSTKAFKARQKKAFHYQQSPEQISDSENFYSFFEKIDGEGRYQFYLYPETGNKIWLDTTQNSADSEKFYFYQNTFDFEFLDTNARRNDIFYKDAKRFIKLKQNRPYDIEEWQYFKEFKNFFEKRTSQLQKLVSLIYSKLEDWQGNDGSFQKFILSSFVNILDLKDNKDKLAQVLGLTSFDGLKNMNEKEFKEKMLMFIDMFEFWHTALKEV